MTILEESAQMVRLLEVLDAGGARRPEGWQVIQEELSDRCGFPSKRQLYTYLVRAKAHGLVVVTATHEDVPGGGWGHRKRLPDTYHLQVTVAEWEQMRPAVVERVKATARAKMSAKSKAAQMERSRKVRLAERVTAKPARAVRVEAPAAVPIDEEAVAALAATLDDDDLAGW